MRSQSDISQRLAGLPRLISVSQAAEELGLPVWTLKSALWKGQLAHVRLGRLIRLERNDLEAWITSRKVRGPVL